MENAVAATGAGAPGRTSGLAEGLGVPDDRAAAICCGAGRFAARVGLALAAGVAAEEDCGAGVEVVRTTGLSLSTGPGGRAVGLAVPGGRLNTSCAFAGRADRIRPSAIARLLVPITPERLVTVFTLQLPALVARAALNRE